MRLLFLFLLLAAPDLVLANTPELSDAVIYLRTLVSCPDVLSLDREQINALIQPYSAHLHPLYKACAYPDQNTAYLDLVLAKTLKEDLTANNTWYLSLFAWKLDYNSLLVHQGLLRLHLTVVLGALSRIKNVPPANAGGLDYGKLFSTYARMWCTASESFRECASALDRTAEILNTKGQMLVPAPNEVLYLIQKPNVQSAIHDLYQRLEEISASVTWYDHPRKPQMNLWELTLEASQQNRGLALTVLGFLANRESKSLVSYGPLLIQKGLYTPELGLVLWELSQIFPLARLIDYGLQAKHVSPYLSFSYPPEIAVASSEPYHFWSSVYMTDRLLKDGFSKGSSVLASYAFGRAYNIASNQGQAVRSSLSQAYWKFVYNKIKPQIQNLGLTEFAEWLARPSDSLLALMPYHHELEYWLDRERAEWIHLVGAMWAVDKNLVQGFELEPFVRNRFCVGPVNRETRKLSFARDPESFMNLAKKHISAMRGMHCEDTYLRDKYSPNPFRF